MSPQPSNAYLAPGLALPSYRLPGTRQFPRIDDHVVQPETREEMVRGVRMEAMPANPPHAEQQVTLDHVLAPHVAPGFVGATDLLTRFSEGSNFASDFCIYQDGIDPESGTRHLEQLAFEIVSTQTRRNVSIRAEDMIERGVRRVIAIFVKTSTIEEWNRETGRFEPLDLDGVLVDLTLTRPLPLRALLDRMLAYDEAAKGLDSQGVPYMQQIRREAEQKGKREGKREGRHEGKREGKRDTLARLLERRFGPIPAAMRLRLAAATAEQLDAWFDRVLDAASLDDVLR